MHSKRLSHAEVEGMRGLPPPPLLVTGRGARPNEPGGGIEGDHVCQVCGKRFNFPSLLTRHMRIHTGERPFPCPYCSHRANQKSNLIMHIRSNHSFITNPGTL
ncbi:Zinc finger protein 516-like 4 [Homarus americanus]|uniref:Zinc finger protein 516-like 4 n=1 Tax=Homarus americanus TaxID=6706 RepID=A0A8J5K4H1_HOMAM|nr:Zinc finger protein 516-like 4 [Homarus americanus]